MPQKLIIHGCYANNNFGDLLLHDIMSAYLSKQYPVETVCPWVHRRQRGRLLGSSGRGVRGCVGAAAAVFGGGGYLNDRNGDRTGMRRLLRYSLPSLLWRATRTPYVSGGVGAGPLVSSAGARRVRSVCRGAAAIAVRDEASRDVLVRVGVKAEDIEVTADLVMLLTPEDLPIDAVGRASELIGPRVAGQIRLGIHLESLARDGSRIEQVIREIASRLGTGTQIQPIWITDTNRSTRLAQRVQAIAKQYLPSLRYLSRQDHWTTAALINELDAVITSKLHVGITAWAMGVPACGFSSHPKSKRFYQQVGRSAFQADTDEAQPQVVGDWVELLQTDFEAFGREDVTIRPLLRERARRNFQIIDEHIGPFLRTA